MRNSKREENRRKNVHEIYGAASEAATRVATKMCAVFYAHLPKEVPSGLRQNVKGLKNTLPPEGTDQICPFE